MDQSRGAPGGTGTAGGTAAGGKAAGGTGTAGGTSTAGGTGTAVVGDIEVVSLHHRRAAHRWDRTAVGDMIERMTWSFPDRLAFIGAEGAYSDPAFARVSYREADRLANRIAQGLLARGLTQGDVVALVCENSVEAFLFKLGVAKAGLVVAPLNPSMAADVVTDILRRIEPALVVVDAEVWPPLAGAVEAAGCCAGVTIEIGGGVVPGSVGFAAFLAGGRPDEPDVEIHGDDIWELLFTSGTTASPKAVMLSHSAGTLGGYGFALSLTRGLRIEDELVLCSYLPLIYHVGDNPFALGTFAAGGTLVLGRRPDPRRVAATVAAERVTALWAGSPQLLRAVAEVLDAEQATLDARDLRVIVYGWAALHPETLATLERVCAPDLLVFGIFGQTEAIACHRFWPSRWEETYRRTAPRSNYVGVPSPLLGSTVMDADGRSLADSPGQPGEAVYRSPVIMSGYYKDEAATRHAMRYGWFHSGDSCVYDDDGLRIMVDRFKDVIKSGGENVSSLRVESVLVQHPAVARAAVVGLPHDHWGEAVTAVVVAREGCDVDAEEVIAFCRRSLAGFETPKAVVVVDDLPETVGGKVLKYRLRSRFEDLYDSGHPVS
jgi:acyl-CoA synthetase (AMP-forming)/AMP-acid ligase II